MKKMKGVIVPMTTSYTDSGAVDFRTMEKITAFLVEKGIQYLYPCGTTGEMHLLSVDERKRIAETVIDAAGGRADVFVQCGAVKQEETLELIRHAKEAGADGIGVVTPSFFGLDDEELIAYYDCVCETAGDRFPVYLYNIPQCSGNDISADACRRIAEQNPNVVGIKYSYNNPNRVCEYLSIRNYDFSVLVGLERQYLGYLAMGCDGVVSGCASVFPEIFLNLYKSFQNGDMESALELQHKVDRIFNVLTRDRSNARVKAAEQILGFGNGAMRAPLMSVSSEVTREIERELRDLF